MNITTTLHIGGEKTGTTSLQYFLCQNRETLLRQGIFYPTAPGSVNHVLLAIYASPEENTENLKAANGVASREALTSMLSSLPGALEAELAESGCRRLVLSSEHCSSRLSSHGSVKRVQELLARFSDEVQVAIYVRRQDELLLSAYSTAVRSGRTAPLQIPTGHLLEYYDYAKILDRWAAVFGERHITVRVYDRETLVNGDIIDDFVGLLGVDPPPEGFARPPERLNGSLDSRVTEILRMFNERMAADRQDRAAPAPGFETPSAGSAGRLSETELDDFLRQFERSNAEVARRFLKNSDGRLFPPRPRRVAPPAPEMSAVDAVKLAAELWASRLARRDEAAAGT